MTNERKLPPAPAGKGGDAYDEELRDERRNSDGALCRGEPPSDGLGLAILAVACAAFLLSLGFWLTR